MLAQNSFCIKSTGKYLPQYVNLKRGNKKQTKNGRTIWYLKKKKNRFNATTRNTRN